jgi:hypothetical protein
VTPVESATTFFETIFGDAPADTEIVLMTPPTWRPYGVAPSYPDTAARLATTFHTDTYVAVGLHRAGAAGQRLGRGKADDVVALVAAWADLDVDKPWATQCYLPDCAAARRFIDALPIPPSVSAWTGAGFHLWWGLREPLVLDTDAARAAAARLVRRWQAYLRLRLAPYALDHTHSLATVLRVPGTLHTRHGCRVILEHADGPRVDPSALEDLCDDAAVPDRAPLGGGGAAADGITLDPAAEPPFGKFERLQRTSRLFRDLWHRALAPKDRSQSGFDFKLAMLAADAGWTDAEIVALLIAHRRDGGRPPACAAYYARTIAQARAAGGSQIGRRRP